MTEQTANGSDELFEASDFDETTPEEQNEPTVEASDDGQSATPTNQEGKAAAEGDEPEAQTTDPISDFLATKGIKQDDPDALRKVTEMYQNAEKGFYSKSQRAAQLERQLRDAQSPRDMSNAAGQQSDVAALALNEARKLRMEMGVKDWKTAKNLSPEAEQRMIEWCSQPMTDANGNVLRDANGKAFVRGMNIMNGVLSLDEVYRLSGADTVGVDNLKEKMRAEARQEMVARQNAKRPQANATDSAQFSKPEQKDDFLEGLLS